MAKKQSTGIGGYFWAALIFWIVFLVAFCAVVKYAGFEKKVVEIYHRPDTTITIHNGIPDTVITIRK